MNPLNRSTLIVLVGLLVWACHSPLSTTTTSSTTTVDTTSFTMDSASTQVASVDRTAAAFSLTVELGQTPHDVYFAFTNPSLTSQTAIPQLTASIRSVDEGSEAEPAPPPARWRDLPFRPNLPVPSPSTKMFSRSVSSNPGVASSNHAAGDLVPFRYLTYDNALVTKTATLAAQVLNSSQNRLANVWTVAGTGVTAEMATALVQRFLASSGSGNDIYSWLTSVLGREYYEPGTWVGSGLVTPTGEINIVLCDLNPNRSRQSSLVYGYFWSINDYQSYQVDQTEYSNGSLVFFLDAPIFATPTGSTWELSDVEPAEIVSTLAHEFQHMIHYYQKTLSHGLSTTSDTWLDEMCSMAAEDLVADKLSIPGPRGVPLQSGVYDYTSGQLATNDSSGRLGYFNAVAPKTSLVVWSNTNPLANYAAAYSFGSWLVRNYGGPEVIRSVVQTSGTDIQAVIDAVATTTGKTVTVAQLLNQWATAVLVSGPKPDQHTQLTSEVEGTETAFTYAVTGTVLGENTTYRLGSINAFRYYAYGSTQAGPVMGSGGAKALQPAGVMFRRAGSSLTGSHTFTFSVPTSVSITLVTKVSS